LGLGSAQSRLKAKNRPHPPNISTRPPQSIHRYHLPAIVDPLIFLAMDLQLSNAVLTATFSNEIPNLVTGTIQLAGEQHVIHVELQGNFLSDIAGCCLEITNHVPKTDIALLSQLHRHQYGTAGEMTASRRITQSLRKSAPPASVAIAPPKGSLKNLLFFEWFNEQRQRVLIHAWHWTLRVSPPRWTLTRAQELAQIKAARLRRKDHLLTRGES
ncbi:MAG TPA: hypothetical protein VLE43_09780, partial [Candidatus Saccharimonadia bacterium]|nr:hypothetical protein [Candidatus Saccharimonadia bacterium]